MRTLTTLFTLLLLVGSAHAQRTVTMRLNMASVPDTTNAMDLIEVRGAGGADGATAPATLVDGNVIDWSDASTLELVNEPGPDGGESDYWSVTFQIAEDTRLTHKFFSQQADDIGVNGWEADPNPQIEPGSGDVDLGLHFFQGQADWHGGSGRRAGVDGTIDYNWMPWESKTDSIAVWYRVAMFGTESMADSYDPTISVPDQVVGARGDNMTDGPLDWGATLALDRESMDDATPGYNVYSGVAYYPASLIGMEQNYKFVIEQGDAIAWEEGNVTGNRTFTVPAADTTLHWVYYGDTSPSPNLPIDGQVVFGVDLQAFETIGLFDQAREDTLWVFGDFNGWQGCRDSGNIDNCYMYKDPAGTSFLAPVNVSRPAGVGLGYKYFLDFNDVTFQDAFGRPPPSGWEEGHRTGINRRFEYAGDPSNPQILQLAYFNDVTPENVMNLGDNVEIQFSVTMQEAIDNQAQPFVPGVDSVSIHLGDPVWAHTQGIDGTDHNIPMWDAVVLTDDDQDGTYTGTWSVFGPSYNILTFRYMYGGKMQSVQEMGTDTHEPGRNRAHFIPKNADGSYPATYELPMHSFKLTPGPLPHELNPYILAGIVQSEEIPTKIWLGGNYPNPFNPTTSIEYGLERQAHVQLEVFDMLGRRVASLVDGVQRAATYRVTFDGSKLASGVYIYRLRTGNEALMRQMVMVK